MNIITSVYLVLNKDYNMKTTIKYAILISILWVNNCISQIDVKSKISLKYIGFQKDTIVGNATLVYEIKNNSEDTLFFPSNRIKLKIKRNQEILKSFGCDGFYFKEKENPLLTNYLEEWKNQENELYSIKYSFSSKVMEKSYKKELIKDKLIKDEIINNIYNQSILILPNQKTIRLMYFCNEKLDKECIVDLFYKYSRFFLYSLENSSKEKKYELKY